MRVSSAWLVIGTLGWISISACSQLHGQDGSLFRRGSAAVGNYNNTNNYVARRPQSELGPAGQLPQSTAITPQPMPNNVPVPQGGVTLANASWIYESPPPIRVYKKNDIVTIRVDEISRVQAEGRAESRRNTLYDALLKDWLRLDGIGVKPAAQADGDPRVQGSVNQLYRANATTEARESLTFNIAARIVDVRPNGDLVLEASKMIAVNDNVFETSLTGICRPVDIAADNVVLSRDLLDLQIQKQDRGHLRDGYRRGWFTQWFETLLPF